MHYMPATMTGTRSRGVFRNGASRRRIPHSRDPFYITFPIIMYVPCPPLLSAVVSPHPSLPSLPAYPLTFTFTCTFLLSMIDSECHHLSYRFYHHQHGRRRRKTTKYIQAQSRSRSSRGFQLATMVRRIFLWHHGCR